MHRRYRLGHGSQLHRLWSPRRRRYSCDVRRRPDYPAFDRFWDIVARRKVSIFYTSPTAIRALIRQGDDWPNKHDLSSLRLLGSVGGPINPSAWEWYYCVIGKEKCPIVDTWWQTETGAIMIAPMPGAVPTKPGSATLPMPGIVLEVVDGKGAEVGNNREGFLIIKHPWPSMVRTRGVTRNALKSSTGLVCKAHISPETPPAAIRWLLLDSRPR